MLLKKRYFVQKYSLAVCGWYNLDQGFYKTKKQLVAAVIVYFDFSLWYYTTRVISHRIIFEFLLTS